MKINIKNLEQKVSIGVFEHEKLSKTKVLITLEIFLRHPKFTTVEDVVDYDIVIKKIHDIVTSKHFNYIEELATIVLEEVSNVSLQIQKTKVKIQKCIFGNFIEELSVEVES